MTSVEDYYKITKSLKNQKKHKKHKSLIYVLRMNGAKLTKTPTCSISMTCKSYKILRDSYTDILQPFSGHFTYINITSDDKAGMYISISK